MPRLRSLGYKSLRPSRKLKMFVGDLNVGLSPRCVYFALAHGDSRRFLQKGYCNIGIFRDVCQERVSANADEIAIGYCQNIGSADATVEYCYFAKACARAILLFVDFDSSSLND